MQYSMILSTCPSEKSAGRIAKILLEKKLAACVNTVNGLESRYWWKGKIAKHSECLMIVKTKKPLVKNVIIEMGKAHPYDVPEIIELPISTGNKRFLEWLSKVTK